MHNGWTLRHGEGVSGYQTITLRAIGNDVAVIQFATDESQRLEVSVIHQPKTAYDSRGRTVCVVNLITHDASLAKPNAGVPRAGSFAQCTASRGRGSSYSQPVSRQCRRRRIILVKQPSGRFANRYVNSRQPLKRFDDTIAVAQPATHQRKRLVAANRIFACTIHDDGLAAILVSDDIANTGNDKPGDCEAARSLGYPPTALSERADGGKKMGRCSLLALHPDFLSRQWARNAACTICTDEKKEPIRRVRISYN